MFKKISSLFAEKLIKKMLTIFLLGISSGLPITLIISTLKAVLLEKGFDLKTIGFFSLVYLPYSLKIFIAPLVDTKSLPFFSKSMGRKKSWIVATQILLAIATFFLGVATINHNLTLLASLALLVAIISATQDTVINGYRIEMVAKEDQGLASTFYIYGYYLGMMISGALALGLAEFIAWELVYGLMAVTILFLSLLTLFIDNIKKNQQEINEKNNNIKEWFILAVISPIKDLLKHQSWLFILAFIISFKLGDAYMGSMTLPFLLEIGFSKIEIAKIVKTFGLFATLFGIFFGGYFSKKVGLNKSLWIAVFAQMFSNLSFYFLAKIGSDVDALYLVIFIENFCSGFGSTIFVAYLSNLCSLNFSATQYAILDSMASFARSFLTSSAGIVAQKIGWLEFFIFTTFLASPALLFLFLVNKKNNLIIKKSH
jgi:PAT family beta-lactamase induction signal transducer AmpG